MMIALIAAVTVVGAYCLVGLLLWRYQERIVFQPPLWPVAETADGLLRLAFRASDGTELVAHVIGTVSSDAPVVIAFHGNAVVARWLIPWAREVARRFGTCVILPEYRGYDGLAGSPTYAGSALDARAALDAARDHLRVEPSQIVLFGHSLGSAVATELAAAAGARALVLQAPLSSAREMVSRWPVVGLRAGWSLISRVHYDTVGRVRELDVPVHVAHGERDIVVPVRMGRAVFAAARRPGRMLLLPTAGHNDVPEVGGDEYWRWLADALHSKAL